MFYFFTTTWFLCGILGGLLGHDLTMFWCYFGGFVFNLCAMSYKLECSIRKDRASAACGAFR